MPAQTGMERRTEPFDGPPQVQAEQIAAAYLRGPKLLICTRLCRAELGAYYFAGVRIAEESGGVDEDGIESLSSRLATVSWMAIQAT